MALAWFICGYVINPARPNMRYCAMNDFTEAIVADGGTWSESEILGGYAIVKVRAAAATLTTIAGTTGFQRIPNHINLNDVWSDLTTAQRTAIQNKVLAMGYTLAELQAVMGDTLAKWRTKTLGQLLRFITSRRLKPRWDEIQQQIVLDGILQSCRPIAEVDAEVQ
jgi:hypothetical protein